MNLTLEQRDQVTAELKRFATDLQLSDDQKERLQEFLTEAYAKSWRLPQSQSKRDEG
jgi:hypothetical protein